MKARAPLAAILPLLLSAVLAPACDSGSSDDLSAPVGQGGTKCSSASECKAPTPVCDQLAGTCVQCLFDTDCSGNAVCRGNQCIVPTTCNTSLDCVSLPNATICDPSSSTCVQCATSDDCSGSADCLQNKCVAYEACTTSLDCSQGKVCASTGRCVECELATDCPSDNVCVGNKCEVQTLCQSDNQCTPLGKLCDKTAGYCVDCLTNAQCPDAYHCAAGACALDACQAGASGCQGNSLVVCDAQGQSWGTPQPCPAQTTCKTSGINASCQAWTCDAGLTYCQGDTLITCAADGLGVASSVDCSAQQKHCGAGECRDQLCAPNTVFCEGAQIKQCNTDGTDAFVLQTCGSQQVCNPSTATCVTQLCVPNAPVCNGNIATTCNAAGNGYTAGGTDCAALNKSCDMGSCVGCPPGGGSPANVRLTEVFIGTSDYIKLTNLGSCGAQLDTLGLRIVATDSANNLDVDLPNRVLAPNASVYITDSTTPEPEDIVPAGGANIYLTPDTGEYIALCSGPCSSGVVQDYFAHASGAQPPMPPAGLTFTPGPLTGITTATQDSNAYTRIAYSGGYPAFKSTDWHVGTASRPYVNPSTCPSTQPTSGAACTEFGASCIYGSLTCFCLLQWACQ